MSTAIQDSGADTAMTTAPTSAAPVAAYTAHAMKSAGIRNDINSKYLRTRARC